MFVDACAIIAMLSDEREAGSVADALASTKQRLTSPVAVFEAVIGLARPDKFNLPIDVVEQIVLEFLNERSIEIRDLPPASVATALVLSAAHRYRSGRRRLNLGDCFHYACAKHYDVPILATGGEFSQTDIETVL
jgi:ribonuclease VapC